MKTFISLGVGVNSTAILALIKQGKLVYENPVVVFADTGAERPETYDYLKYLKTVSPIPIQVIQSKEGSLRDYCLKRKCLPQRHMRWCSDRWKQKPLNAFKKERLEADEDWKWIIGIDFDEQQRIGRWRINGYTLVV